MGSNRANAAFRFARPLLVCYTTERRAAARFITHIAQSPPLLPTYVGCAARPGAMEVFVGQASACQSEG